MKRIVITLCVLLTVLLTAAGMAYAWPEDYQWAPDYNSNKDIMPPMPNTPVRFYVQDNHDGTWDLQLTVINLSQYPWAAGQMDLVCTKGQYYLASEENHWKIEEEVPRGYETTMVIPLDNYEPGGKMRFNVKYGDRFIMGFYIRF